MNVGPLFKSGSSNAWTAWISWLPTAATMPICPASPGLISEPSVSNCGIKMLRDTGVLALCMEISVLSIIIMALWQRARKATLTAMRERNASIVAREAEETHIAALAERARIARDMHDVVAHTLSTIIVQSDGGRYAGTHDLAVAKHTMSTIRHEAERAQHDMQRLFGVFGTDDDAGYADIDSLFDGHLVVSRRVTGKSRPDRLTSDADAAVFRLVQEALTNTRKHAGEGAKATIDEVWSDDGLAITVSDNGQGAASAADGHAPGYGLMGMHERIESLGGSIHAGPGPNGGFIVAATIPLSPEIAQTDAEPSDALPVTITRLRKLLNSIRSKPLNQGDIGESNWVARFAQWTERHYLLADILITVALVADSWLAGIKVMSGWNGYDMLIQMLLPLNGESAMSRWLLVLSGLIPGGVVMLFGFACIAMARWSRSRGSNALVLMQREEALKAEQERQKVLAANLERNRIGTAMQAEVLNTLESVITQADDGLAMLNSEPAPDSEQIIAAFTVIGERGRAALAHMRQLLTVLRETGFSDEMHEGAQPDMQLRPAAPLSSQMRQVESTSQTDSSTNMNSGNNQGVHGAALE